MKRFMLMLLAGALVMPLGVLYAADSAQFPDNFRRWVLVGTGVILPGDNAQLMKQEGMHHIFANQKAADGYATGDFADGSIIVFELREAQRKDNGIILEGERKRVDVMIKDANLYKDTGGWRFEQFWGNDQAQNAVHDAGATCFQYHSKANAHGFVFSKLQ